MVFVQYRSVVDEIKKLLDEARLMVRSMTFIGQGTDKKGNKGFKQKEQLEVIEKFKKGEFNTLAAASIGEEGLDIGEADLIVCFEAQKCPVRMVSYFNFYDLSSFLISDLSSYNESVIRIRRRRT